MFYATISISCHSFSYVSQLLYMLLLLDAGRYVYCIHTHLPAHRCLIVMLFCYRKTTETMGNAERRQKE